MALLDSDGCGLSTTIADFFSFGSWLTTGGGVGAATGGPFGDNFVYAQNGGVIGKIFNTPLTTFFLGGRFITNAVNNSSLRLYSPLGNYQLTLLFSSAGAISIYRGSTFGTLLVTSAGGVFPTGSWFYLEVGATIDASAGAITVRVDNVAVPALSLTGINTKGDGSSSQVQQMNLSSVGGNNSPVAVTHLYWVDDSGDAPGNTFLGDVRVQSIAPMADRATAFTPTSGEISRNLPRITSGASSNWSTGTMVAQKIVSPASGTVSDLQIDTTSYSGNFQLGIYDDNSGTPGTLLGTTVVQTNSTNALQTLTMATAGVSVESGSTYWVAVLASATLGVRQVDNIGYPVACATQLVPYASGFPSTAAASPLAGTIRIGMIVSVTSNWEISSETEPSSTSAVNSSSTVGDQDTFDMQPADPALTTIFGVNIKPIVGKTDAGPREVATVLDSGGTVVVGTPVQPVPSGTQLSSMFTTDPHTGADWTIAGANAIAPGYKIVS